MRKEIAESVKPVHDVIDRILEEKTEKTDTVIIVGVGNTVGVIQ